MIIIKIYHELKFLLFMGVGIYSKNSLLKIGNNAFFNNKIHRLIEGCEHAFEKQFLFDDFFRRIRLGNFNRKKHYIGN